VVLADTAVDTEKMTRARYQDGAAARQAINENVEEASVLLVVRGEDELARRHSPALPAAPNLEARGEPLRENRVSLLPDV
jgi:hypothetical protein